MNYYKRHIGDYAAKAGHLSPLEHGVYNLIIDAYYNREEAPTKAEAVRWARARTQDERDAVDAVLTEFFVESDGRFTQNRIEEELSAFRAKQEVNRQLGARGGKANAERNAKPNAKRNATETGSEQEAKQVPHREANDKPSHKPLATNQEEAKSKSPPTASVDPKGEIFARWKSLPGSGGGAFLVKLLKDHKPEQRVLEAIETTLAETRADPKAFVLGVLAKGADPTDKWKADPDSAPWAGALR